MACEEAGKAEGLKALEIADNFACMLHGGNTTGICCWNDTNYISDMLAVHA